MGFIACEMGGYNYEIRYLQFGSGATIPNQAGARWRIGERPSDMEVSCEIGERPSDMEVSCDIGGEEAFRYGG